MNFKTLLILTEMVAYPIAVLVVYVFCLAIMWAGYWIGLPVEPSFQDAALFAGGYFIASIVLGKISDLIMSFHAKENP